VIGPQGGKAHAISVAGAQEALFQSLASRYFCLSNSLFRIHL
jgi:hypothetical protein